MIEISSYFSHFNFPVIVWIFFNLVSFQSST